MSEATSLADKLVEAYQRPDPKPYLYGVGTRVRVCRGREVDGQTPAYWSGAMVEVLGRHCSGLLKQHWYKLRHDNGASCDFKEDELDRRYRLRV